MNAATETRTRTIAATEYRPSLSEDDLNSPAPTVVYALENGLVMAAFDGNREECFASLGALVHSIVLDPSRMTCKQAKAAILAAETGAVVEWHENDLFSIACDHEEAGRRLPPNWDAWMHNHCTRFAQKAVA